VPEPDLAAVLVFDEVRASAGDDRCWHLRSVLRRLDQYLERPLQWIGLPVSRVDPQESVATCEAASDRRRCLSKLIDEIRNILLHYLEAVAPKVAATRLIDTTLGKIGGSSSALKLSTALLFTWWSASQGMLAVVRGINNAYETAESRPWWKAYLVASG